MAVEIVFTDSDVKQSLSIKREDGGYHVITQKFKDEEKSMAFGHTEWHWLINAAIAMGGGRL